MASFLLAGAADAQSPATPAITAQATDLDGPRLTCVGAERAGTASGVAAWSGKWLGSWPGLASTQGYTPGPYADEKPLRIVTAANAASEAARLTEGQQSLLKRYPQTFSMPVYASHRDFRLPDWACATIRKNAASARLVHDGKGVDGEAGAIPFPLPKSGLEAIWNVLQTTHVWNETATIDIADVYDTGAIARGRQKYLTLSPSGAPDKRGSMQDPVGAYFLDETLLPERKKGTIGVGYQPNDFAGGSTHVWAYDPGTRRLRQAPDIAFDYPTPPSGLRTVDDDGLFNGSPERYDWTLLGKREAYVPYNNFRVNDPAVPYSRLLTPNTLNPEFVRYELHRVWVIEGRLKPGLRHVYSRRRLYVDEDTWLPLWADNYDARGGLYRTAYVLHHYVPEAQVYHRGVSVYHDLDLGAYEAGYLVNEAGSGAWRFNRTDLTPQMFSASAATQHGH